MSSHVKSSLFERIYDALPQTQCTRCGYPDCAAYAQSIASGDASINQCPPGGSEGVQRLAAITGLPVLPLDPANGTEGPRSVAIIDEAWCIGCTLCIPVCPTDAILGSNKMMHIVIEPYCTGCELCIQVCPVDCISMENVTAERTGWAAWSESNAELARKRYDFHSNRRARDAGESQKIPEEKAVTKLDEPTHDPLHTDPTMLEKKRVVIEAALARARAKRDSR